MEEKYCQSCGMPMGETDELYGTQQDGSKSTDYCKYCYEKGTFTSEVTMEEEIEICVPILVEEKVCATAEEARAMMKEFFPSLKRWKQA